VLATGRQTTIKIIKIKQQLFVTMDNSRPKYKKIDRFLGEYKILGEYSPLWMPRINTVRVCLRSCTWHVYVPSDPSALWHC